MTYCCRMREKYLIGILAENTRVPTPVEAVDFMDFDQRAPDGRPILVIKFCPFCGSTRKGCTRVLDE